MFWPKIPDLASLGGFEADDGVEQHCLAGAGAADDANDLATRDGEVELFVDDRVAKGRGQSAHGDGRGRVVELGRVAIRGLRSGHTFSFM